MTSANYLGSWPQIMREATATLEASVGVVLGSFVDHYDVPQHRYDELVALGAQPVDGHQLIRRLIASGLRVPARDRRRSAHGDG